MLCWSARRRWRIVRFGRQAEGEARAFTAFAFGAHFSLMPSHDALDRGQPDPRAGKLIVRMKALEGREKFPGISHVKTRAIVPDEEERSAIFRLPTELDEGLRFFAGKLPRVAEQILQSDAEQGGVASHAKLRLDSELNARPLRFGMLQLARNG